MLRQATAQYNSQDVQYRGQTAPVISQLLKTINAKASDCIMLEDNLEALKTAKRLGMKTVWVSKKLHKPSYVDYRVSSVLALTHIKI